MILRKRPEERRGGWQGPRANYRIKAPKVRVISPEGEQLGVFATEAAVRMATERDLDLVEIAPNVDPPVCKIMDLGKYKYEQSKKLAEARKKQTVIHIKEVKMRPTTDEHDYQFKLRHMKRFLADKDKAKVTVQFRGREVQFSSLGMNLIRRIMDDLKDDGVVEQPAKMEGRALTMILAPK